MCASPLAFGSAATAATLSGLTLLRGSQCTFFLRYLSSQTTGNKRGNTRSNDFKRSLKPVYASAGVYRDRAALVEDLLANAVYVDPSKNGLVALNKPIGVPVRSADDADVSLFDVLPSLAKELQVETLLYVRAPERYSSGLTLLATHEQGYNRLKKCLNRSERAYELKDAYLAVTNGVPRLKDVTEAVDVVLTKVGKREHTHHGRHFEPVIERRLHSKSRLRDPKKERIRRVRVHSRVLSSSGFGPASLVSVEPSATCNHFIQVYLADLLSPALGDAFYSYRVRELMGKMTKVPVEMTPHDPKETLPIWMLDRMGLRKGDEQILPKHIHLFRTTLNGFSKNKSEGSLSLTAPPPTHFEQTAAAIGIRYNLDEVIGACQSPVCFRAAVAESARPAEEDFELPITHESPATPASFTESDRECGK